jgi:hypothetical protein
MKQRAHAWVALRALKLIDDLNKAPKFVELMSYYLSDVWDGAWLPDTLIVDMRYGHIFKMDNMKEYLDYNIENHDHRKISFTELDDKLYGNRKCLDYVKGSSTLNTPYWVHKTKSGHLPNRVIAISHNVGDMLKMSDYPMAFYVKKVKSKAYREDDLSKMKVKDLTLSPNFSARQIAVTSFILSHYICDAHMPLHCDLRDYGPEDTRRLPAKLHPSIETKWESQFPVKETIMLHDYIKKSVDNVVIDEMPQNSIIEIDSNPKYNLSERLTKIKGDEWDEMVNICRTSSFAVSRKWINDDYESVNDIPDSEFKEVSNYIFHDAVESVARIWLKAWERFAK